MKITLNVNSPQFSSNKSNLGNDQKLLLQSVSDQVDSRSKVHYQRLVRKELTLSDLGLLRQQAKYLGNRVEESAIRGAIAKFFNIVIK